MNNGVTSLLGFCTFGKFNWLNPRFGRINDHAVKMSKMLSPISRLMIKFKNSKPSQAYKELG
ncbi:hypothetical protein AAX09_01135 [Moraxella bovoculi]|nr:hypothetical protein AAX09_01135 [Moraxella bovoculi]